MQRHIAATIVCTLGIGLATWVLTDERFAGAQVVDEGDDAEVVDPIAPEPVAPLPPEQLQRFDELSLGFRQVARRFSDSVVGIEILRADAPLALRRLRQQVPATKIGSRHTGHGIVISDSGLILTSAHPLRQSLQAQIRLADGSVRPAEIVGVDPTTGFALLKTEPDALIPIVWADSDTVLPGQWVLALSHPAAGGAAMSAGIVSDVRPIDPEQPEVIGEILTDAAFPETGGVLVNLRGEVVGLSPGRLPVQPATCLTRRGIFGEGAIPTPPAPAARGFSTVIPSNQARLLSEEILERGDELPGFLGVHLQTLTPALAQTFNFDGVQGVLIADVIPGTAAADIPLKAGDVVTAIGDTAVGTQAEFRAAVATVPAGTAVNLTFYRNGERFVEPVVMGGRFPLIGAVTPQPVQWLAVVELTPALREQLGIPVTIQGVLVSEVAPPHPLLKPHDIILAVGSQPISTVEEFDALTPTGARQGRVRFTVLRDGQQHFAYLQTDQ